MASPAPLLPTREGLIAAAGALLEEDGPEGVTMREVGSRAGLSRGAAYKHFEGKAGLLAAVAAADFRALGEAIGRAVAGIDDPIWRLEAVLLAYLRFAAEHPDRYRVMFAPHLGEAEAPELAEAASETRGAFVAAVAAAIDAGAMPPGTAGQLAAVLLSTVHGAADLARSGHLTEARWGVDDEGVVHALVARLATNVSAAGRGRR